MRAPSPRVLARQRSAAHASRTGPLNRHGQLGRRGEEHAIRLLEASGYVVVGRNVRVPGGEIDVICTDGDVVVFVEVKTRASTRFGSALAAVDARKRRKLRELAADWLQIAAPHARARFDVVTIDGPRAVLHRGAFA
ncbi:MAG: YraN family protein [Candidatus Velthaea sp.]